jgi:hypothetical protein
MFDGIEDWNYGKPPKKNYGCLIIILIPIILILFGIFLGWMIF